jgi:dTDP-4-amino-4,6-dideoxygalactose transaminase
MDEIQAAAAERSLRVIEDCSHAPLAEFAGRKLGTIGDAGCFSFFSNKNMTTGEGGMLISQSEQVAEVARSMRSHGMTSGSYERFKGHAFGYDVVRAGYNYRMDEMRAALGIRQLAKLERGNRRRAELVAHYRAVIQARLPELTFPFDGWKGEYGYHIFPVMLPERGPDRHTVMQRLAERGIQTSIHYRPIHHFTAYRGLDSGLPVTDRVAPRILSLPLYPGMHDGQVALVVDELAACLA